MKWFRFMAINDKLTSEVYGKKTTKNYDNKKTETRNSNFNENGQFIAKK